MTLTEFKKQSAILTVDIARAIKGAHILWMYDYPEHQQETQQMVVGDIVSEWDYNRNTPCEGFDSLTDRWEQQLDDKAKREFKNTLLLLDENGKDRFIRCYDGKNFTCSDADREVLYQRI